MKYLTILLLLFFSFPPAWSQDEAKDPDASEKTAEESNEESEPIVETKPERLPSRLSRERFPKSEKGAMELLAESLPESSLVWLDTEYGPFLSLWQQDRSGDAKGALLIIHAEGEHPAWPKTTKPLHETLPNNGWATLAISLPLPDKMKPPERTFPPKVRVKPIEISEDTEEESDEQNKTEAIAEDENKKPEEDSTASSPAIEEPSLADPPSNEIKHTAEELTEKRLEAALTYLHDKGQFNLVILGSGYGAIRAHDFLNKITPKIDNPALKAKLERPMRAIIIVNGRNKLPTMQAEYEDWFFDPEIPVLDIYTLNDSRNKFDADKRKILATQKKVAIYKQVRIPILNAEKSWKENILSRRIRSFLDNNAVGIEVENKKLNRLN